MVCKELLMRRVDQKTTISRHCARFPEEEVELESLMDFISLSMATLGELGFEWKVVMTDRQVLIKDFIILSYGEA